MNDPRGIKVGMRAAEGDYLTGVPPDWETNQNYLSAPASDYNRDRVAEQLELVRKVHGIVMEAAPLDSKRFFEVCDGCDQLVGPLMLFFDGERFLSPGCRAMGQSTERYGPAT